MPEPDPKAVALITEGREKTDGFGTTGQAPGTLIPWRHNPKNALYYDSSTRDVVPYSGGCWACVAAAAAELGLGLGLGQGALLLSWGWGRACCGVAWGRAGVGQVAARPCSTPT